MPSGSRVTLVWQLVKTTASAHKTFKICHFVGLKKVSAIVCVFYEKPQLKNPLNARKQTVVLPQNRRRKYVQD